MDLLQIIKVLAKGKIVQNWVHYIGCSRNFTAFHINCLLLSHNYAALHRCFVQFVLVCFAFLSTAFLEPPEVKPIDFLVTDRQACSFPTTKTRCSIFLY